MSLDARTAVLNKVKAALAGTGQRPDAQAQLASWSALPRTYAQRPSLSPAERLHLLQDRLQDYDAVVRRVPPNQVSDAIVATLAARGTLAALMPPGFPPEWRPVTANLFEDQGFAPHELDRFDGVVTAATLAIADTGTLVLQNVPGQGRRAATLVPDFHLCVVRVEDVVESVPEAFARLAHTKHLLTTFISGPSATADIEMT
jgi:L-lactate dehydrogenase complex protein LldG